MQLKEIILPRLFNTYNKPENPNNYTVWIPKHDDGKCEIYIDKKWYEFIKIEIEPTKTETETEEEKDNKVITDKEYNLIKAIREYIKKEDE